MFNWHEPEDKISAGQPQTQGGTTQGHPCPCDRCHGVVGADWHQDTDSAV